MSSEKCAPVAPEEKEDTMADTEPSVINPTPDISVLKQPIALGSSDVLQLLQYIKSGTEEVRCSLINGCKIIYECQACCSLFRGLANFVAHKRIYCQTLKNKGNLLMGNMGPALSSLFVEPSAPECDVEEEIPDKKSSPPKPSDYYKNIADHIDFRNSQRKEVIIKLQRIDGNNSAVFQNISKEKSSVQLTGSALAMGESKVTKVESQKTTKLHSALHRKIDFRELFNKISFCDVKKLRCNQCNISYQSFKSLKRHMLNKHQESSTKNFHCPKCKVAFSKFWNLTRHLLTLHKMSRQELDTFKHDSKDQRLSSTQASSSQSKEVSLDKEVEQEKENMEEEGDNEEVQNDVQMKHHDDLVNKTLSNPSQVKCEELPAQQMKPNSIAISSNTKDFKFDFSGVQFKQGFKLMSCSNCGKAFGKEDAYKKHIKICEEEITSQLSHEGRKILNESFEDGMMESESETSERCSLSDVSEQEENALHNGKSEGIVNKPKSPENQQTYKGPIITPQKLKEGCFVKGTFRAENCPRMNQREMRLVKAVINKQENRCLKCGMRSSEPKVLYHHAAKHLGWERFKCKWCIYMSYNISDCKNHIRRAHTNQSSGAIDVGQHILVLDSKGAVKTRGDVRQRSNLREIIKSPKKLNI